MSKTAEDWKQEGNDHFRRKEYAKAVDCYTEAIALDSRNAVLFNNRAGAYLELSRFELAVRDADMATIIEPNGATTAKAHSRMGRAQWAMGKHGDALASYKKASSLAPDNGDYKDSIRTLENFTRSPQNSSSSAAGSGSGSAAGGADANALTEFKVDVVIIVAALLHFVTMLFSAWISVMAWKVALLAMAGRQLIALLRLCPERPAPTFGFAKALFSTAKFNVSNFCVQFLWMPLALLAMGTPTIHLLLFAFVLYAIIDCACPMRPNVRAVVEASPMGQQLLVRAAPYLQKAEHPQMRQMLLLNAAMCEACGGLMAPLAGAGMFGTIIMFQWLKMRYRGDPTVKQAYSHLRMQLGQWAHHQRAPGIIGTGFDKVCDLMHRFATA